MPNLIQAARDQVAQLTQAAYEKAAAQGLLPAGQEIRGTVEVPKDSRNGDFASSFAMAGAKALHMAPRQIAQIVLDHLELEAPCSSAPRSPGRGSSTSSTPPGGTGRCWGPWRRTRRATEPVTRAGAGG